MCDGGDGGCLLLNVSDCVETLPVGGHKQSYVTV